MSRRRKFSVAVPGTVASVVARHTMHMEMIETIPALTYLLPSWIYVDGTMPMTRMTTQTIRFPFNASNAT